MSTERIDPAVIMAAHVLHRASRSGDGCTMIQSAGGRCVQYRLAEALVASEAKIAAAWDEGYEDGVLDGRAQGSGAPGAETANPHRQASDELKVIK